MLEDSRSDVLCHVEDSDLLFITIKDTEDRASSMRINMMHRINLLKNKLSSKIRSLTVKNINIIDLTTELLAMKKSLHDQDLKAERVSTSLADSDESIKLNENQINCLHVELDDCYSAIEASTAAHRINEENHLSEILRFQHTVLDLEDELQKVKDDRDQGALILESTEIRFKEELLTAANKDKQQEILLAALEIDNSIKESALQV
jgi:hypothetical protein